MGLYKYIRSSAGLSADNPMFEFVINNPGQDNDGDNKSYQQSYVWSNWKTFEDSGAPPPEKKQKEADVVQPTVPDVKPSGGISARVTFDPRLTKPRNGNPFGGTIAAFDPTNIRPAFEGDNSEGDKSKPDPEDDTTAGVPAIHNWYAHVTLSGGGTDAKGKSLFFDVEGERRWYETDDLVINGNPMSTKNVSKNPTTTTLVQYGTFDKLGRTPYYYTDFAYCKYWRKIENNRLITLRRYAVPTFGSLEFPDFNTTKNSAGKYDQKENKFMPVAQAVTWMGAETNNLQSSIMSFGVSLPWGVAESKVEDNEEQQGSPEETFAQGGMMRSFFRTLSVASGEATNSNIRYGGQTPPDPYENGPYANRIKGPVNRIDKVKKRDPGLEFKHQLKLNFHYTARSIGAINTKAAMLDIIANFLLLTYGNGAFWGGARRFRGHIQSYPWKAGMAAWYAGDPIAFGNALKTSVQTAMTNIASLFGNALKDPIGTLQGVFKTGMMMALAKTNSNQMFHGYRALLTGEPVGEWHLVVGNPLNPMMMIGNLVCTDCQFKFGDELGPDDFPTELTVEVTLDHGMSLDRAGVESMFNRGRGRIYTLPSGIENTSAANETKVDAYTGKNNNPYVNKVMNSSQYHGSAVGSKPSWAMDTNGYETWVKDSGKSFMDTADASINMVKKSELGYVQGKTLPPEKMNKK